jgi:hypothetical protein
MEPTKHVVILFRNGRRIEFEATNITVTRSVVTGELTGVKWEGAKGAVPLWMDVTEVVAITYADPS